MNVEETMVMVEGVTVCAVLVVDKDCLKTDADASVADASVVGLDVASEARSVVRSVNVVGLADVAVRSSAAGNVSQHMARNLSSQREGRGDIPVVVVTVVAFCDPLNSEVVSMADEGASVEAVSVS